MTVTDLGSLYVLSHVIYQMLCHAAAFIRISQMRAREVKLLAKDQTELIPGPSSLLFNRNL